jgi:hypothetical protein
MRRCPFIHLFIVKGSVTELKLSLRSCGRCYWTSQGTEQVHDNELSRRLCPKMINDNVESYEGMNYKDVTENLEFQVLISAKKC